MLFSYSVPARRFYSSPVIDGPGLRYAADRPLVDNAQALARADWGPPSAARAERLAQLITAADPSADEAPHARQWVAAILCAVSDGNAATLALIEDRTGVGPAETLARVHELRSMLSPCADLANDDDCVPLER